MNLQEYLFWSPDNYLNFYRGYGIGVYNLATLIALAGGALFFWWSLTQLKIETVKKIEALAVVVVCAVIFTRMFHIVFWDLHNYLLRPHNIFRVDVGRSIHGAVFGFIVATVIIAKLLQRPLLKLADSLSFWPVWGLIFARIGNLYNSEMIGTPTGLPWAFRFYFSADHGGIPRHPVQIYEALFTLVLLAVMGHIYFRWTGRKPGLVAAVALTGLSTGRFIFDYVKNGPGFLFGDFLSTGQVLSIPFFLLGIGLLGFLYLKKQPKQN